MLSPALIRLLGFQRGSWSETARGKGELKSHPNIINIADERKKKHLETFGSFLIIGAFSG
jgi:hypothetical protein